MKYSALLMVIIALVASSAACAAEAFAAGQTWTYHTGPGQSASRVVVLRVEEYRKRGRIIHATVVGLTFRRTPDSAPEPWTIGHMPIAEAALRRSVRKLESVQPTTPSAGFEESYPKWKETADSGNVQHWPIPVADVVRQIEKWIREGRTK